MPAMAPISRREPSAPKTTIQPPQKVDILVAGSVAVDLACDFSPFAKTSTASPVLKTSNPARIAQSIGGVGHNVATAAHLIGGPNSVRLCSLVADDLAGSLILSTLKDRGLDTVGIMTLKQDVKDPDQQWRTAQYVSVNDSKKDLVLAMADMDIIGSASHSPSTLWPTNASSPPKWVVVDGNWDASVIQQWLSSAQGSGAKTAFEPVSVAKSARIFSSLALPSQDNDAKVFPAHAVDLTSPNEQELIAMHGVAKENGHFEGQKWWLAIDALGIPSSGARAKFMVLTSRRLVDDGIPQRVVQLLPFIPNILTKLGAEGISPSPISLAHVLLNTPFHLDRN
jgi:pseudouridine-5'-phosphate glycosidase/pseudouridine kinase